MTIDLLAARSGLSRNAVLNLLNGDRGGALTSWYHLAYGLGIPLSDLVIYLDA
jgi:transcriptional regulator with XRE-family HTH domain